MASQFDQFYNAVSYKELDWPSLREVLRINEESYPNNAQILAYYQENFNGKTSCLSRTKWHRMDKLLCIWVVAMWSILQNKNMLALDKSDFAALAAILGVSPQLLEFKWLKLIKPYLKNRPWCEEEDAFITQMMSSKLHKKWTEIALKLSECSSSSGLRTAKQVRERWINYIDPNIKRDEWTVDEDSRLIKMIKNHGKRWSVLGKHLQRTENSIKNRFYSIVGKLKQSADLQSPSLSSLSSQELVKNELPCALRLPIVCPSTLFDIHQPEMKVALFKSLESKVCGYRMLEPEEMA